MAKKEKTVNLMKAKRQVPEQVNEARKKYVKTRKLLMEALVGGSKTVAQLAAQTGLALPETMYYLMTLQRFGDIEVEGLDDSDEYYWYKLKARK